MDSSYAVCSAGAQQSPIDLIGAVPAELKTAAINWKPITLKSIVNNGHTIQVNTSDGGYLELEGARYDLVQFHFHHLSEHTVAGVRFPMEAHFVHKSVAGGGLAVVGVFLVEGAESAALAPIWAAMPQKEGTASADGVVDAKGLLPNSPAAFRYAGSLTTPPCSETVAWTVFQEPVNASKDQIAAFAAVFPNNFRPVQPLNRRFILISD